MSEKLKRLAEAQAALQEAESEREAGRGLLHAAEFGRMANIRNERGNTGPVDKRYLISNAEARLLATALREHLKTINAKVDAAKSELEGMLK